MEIVNTCYLNEYRYWFKHQTSALTILAIGWGMRYIIWIKMEWREVIVLNPDYLIKLASYTLTFIFMGPFIYRWWNTPHRESNNKKPS